MTKQKVMRLGLFYALSMGAGISYSNANCQLDNTKVGWVDSISFHCDNEIDFNKDQVSFNLDSDSVNQIHVYSMWSDKGAYIFTQSGDHDKHITVTGLQSWLNGSNSSSSVSTELSFTPNTNDAKISNFSVSSPISKNGEIDLTAQILPNFNLDTPISYTLENKSGSVIKKGNLKINQIEKIIKLDASDDGIEYSLDISPSSIIYNNQTYDLQGIFPRTIYLKSNQTDQEAISYKASETPTSFFDAVVEGGDWYGRWFSSKNYPHTLSWGGGLKFEVANTDEIDITINALSMFNDANKYSYRYYEVGSKKLPSYTVHEQGSKKTDTINIQGLDQNKTYMIEFFKDTESYNSQIAITDIKGNSNAHVIKLAKPLLFEFVGDSIMAGYNDIGTPEDRYHPIINELGSMSYGSVLSNLYGVDDSVIVRSGIGVTTVDGGLQKPMQTFYDLNYYPVSEISSGTGLWSFKDQADVVFIALSTNDASAGQMDNFINNYRALVNQIRGHYPNAFIVGITNLYNTNNEAQSFVTANDDIKTVISSLGSNYAVIDTSKIFNYPNAKSEPSISNGKYSLDSTHPTLLGHQLIATYICNKIKNAKTDNLDSSYDYNLKALADYLRNHGIDIDHINCEI